MTQESLVTIDTHGIYIHIYFNYSISLVGIRVGVTVKVDSSVEAYNN
jgi:hypothetical protein